MARYYIIARMPSKSSMVGDVKAAIRFMISAQIPNTYCFLIIAIIDRMSDRGTKMIAKTKIPRMPNIRAHIPTAEPERFSTITTVDADCGIDCELLLSNVTTSFS